MRETKLGRKTIKERKDGDKEDESVKSRE